MMLDSSLGKILKNKPAEPAIQTDDRLSPTKEVDDTSACNSEAEVRLVVRFFVEEHIVFNGKIEKVRQLESEEVSRIVSRIAWDGSKSCEESPVEIDHLPTGSIDAPSGQNVPTSSSKISDSFSAYSNPSVDVEGEQELNEQVTDSALNPAHDVTTVKSSPDNNVPLRDIETIVAQDEMRIGKSKSGNLVLDQSCDRHMIDHLVSDKFDEKDRNMSSGISGPEVGSSSIDDPSHIILEPEVSKQAENDEAFEFEFCPLLEDEYQIVIDALNDCIDNVEIEILKMSENVPFSVDCKPDIDQIHEKVLIETAHTNLELNRNLSSISETHNTNLQRHKDKSDKRPLVEAANFPLKSEVYSKDLSNIKKNSCFSDVKVRHDQLICKEDLSIKMVPVKRPENISPNSRRSTTDHGSSSKRMRRTSPKNGRKNNSTDKYSKKKSHLDNDQKVPTRSRTSLSSISVSSINPTATTEVNLPETAQSSHRAKGSKIFAKWTDNHYYPGTILRPSKDRKFTIGYFDGAQRNVVETDLIPLCNILGKQVRVSLAGDYCVNAIVHDEKRTSSDASPLFDVEYQQDGVVRRYVPMKDIFLTAEQGAPLINQIIRPDKNPDESMFAGVDLDNIVHVKRSRRLQELEDSDFFEDTANNQQGTVGNRRKKNQYNTRHIYNKSKTGASNPDMGAATVALRGSSKSFLDVNLDTPASSCSPDGNTKTNLNGLSLNPPSESNSSASIGSTNSTNVLEMGQEFYFDSSSPHRTKTSLLL